MRRSRVLFLIVSLTSACAASPSSAAIAAADNAHVFTQRDYVKSLLAYNRHVLTGAYDDVGKKDPKWDEPAKKFLDAMAAHFAGLGQRAALRPPGDVPYPALHKLGRAAIDAGCNDSLVLHCYAIVLSDGEYSPDDAQQMLRDALDGYADAKYPVGRIALAAGRAYDLADSPKRRSSAWDKFQENAIKWMSQPKYEDIERRFVLDVIWRRIEEVGSDQQQAFIDAFAAADAADPWIKAMLLGRREIKAAWEARGGGWANSVSDEGWKGFFEHLAQARKRLTFAYEIEPNYPEPAADMITVAMGAGGRLGENEREWFDKAVTSQLDYEPAYNGYIWSIYPRWGGSHPQMYDFGVECLRTNRFDTGVPYELVGVLNRIAADGQGAAAWQLPNAYENLSQMCDGYAKAEPGQADWYRSFRAAIAWRTNRFDEASTLIEQLGAKMDFTAFDRFGVMGQLAASHAFAMNGPHSRDIEQAEQNATLGHLDLAIESYEHSLKKTGESDKSRYFLASRLRQLQWQKKFEAGDAVDVQPDETFAGWCAQRGKWSVDDTGALVGTFDETGAMSLLCQAAFLGDSFFIEGDIELPGGGFATGGFVLAIPDSNYPYGCWLRRFDDGKAELVRHLWPVARDAVQLKPTNTLRLAITQATQLSAQLNGNDIFRRAPIPHFSNSQKRYAGVGSIGGEPGATVRITHLKIKRTS